MATTLQVDSFDTDKYIEIRGEHFNVKIDYDDVNHPEVEAAILHLEEVIEEHWDEERFDELFKIRLKTTWNKNEYDLQDDYDSFEDYIIRNGA